MSNIEPLKKVMIHSQAAEVIEKYIRENDFKIGDKLPSEREMASMLSIGRNSVREALRTLEAMNLIEVVNGRGVFVRDINTMGSINVQVTAAKVDFLELLDIRRVLETHAIELAIKNASKAELDQIEEALLEIERKYAQGIYPVEEDNDFHNAIYRACHNKTLCELIMPLASTFDNLWEPFGQEAELIMETLPLHRPLFEAIRDGRIRDAKKLFNRIMDMDERKIINFRGKQ